MANNNGNIIGAAHSAYSGVWDTQDQYQQALAGNWPAAVVTYWEPDNAATAPIGWWKAKTGLSANLELTLSVNWNDDSGNNKHLNSGTPVTNADLNPMFVYANRITTVSSEYGSQDYTPLCFGNNVAGQNNEANQVAKVSNLASDSNHATVAMVVRKNVVASTDVPLFLIGGDQSASKATDASGVGTMMACYINGQTDAIYFNDNGNTTGLTASAGSSNANWTSNATYAIIIVRAKLSSGDSSINVYDSGDNSSGTLVSRSMTDNSNDGSGSHFELSSSDTNQGFALGNLTDIRGTSSDDIQMSSSSNISILETVVYSHEVSDADIQKLEGYFYHKFKGDTESPDLQSGHPYLTSAPTV